MRYTRSVQNILSHFEYVKNWEPIRWHLSVYLNKHCSMEWLSLQWNINEQTFFTSLFLFKVKLCMVIQSFTKKRKSTKVYQPLLHCALCNFRLFPKLKFKWKCHERECNEKENQDQIDFSKPWNRVIVCACVEGNNAL